MSDEFKIKARKVDVSLVDIAYSTIGSDKEYGMKIADHKLICKILDNHTESLEHYMAEIVQAQNDRMFNLMKEQSEAINEIKSSQARIECRIDVIEGRLKNDNSRLIELEKSRNKFERYASVESTLIRIIAAVVTSVLIAIGIHKWWL
jgi:hypothetical protein